MPDAWTKLIELIESEDELVVELLSAKVEDLCGVRPDADAVAAFLRGQLITRSERPRPAAPRRPRQPTAASTTASEVSTSVGYGLYGQQRRARNARDVLMQVFRQFAERDPSFLERFAAPPKRGRKRRYLARTREELYPGSPHLVDNAYEVRPGWWVDTHASRAGIETRIRMACEVAGVQYGKDLIVNLG